MEKLIPVGLIVLLLGALILVWAKSLNRRKLISNGQETSNSVVGTIFVVIGAAMMAEKGYSHEAILRHYFPHTTIEKKY